MKISLIRLILLFICLLFVFLLSSCSDPLDTTVETTESTSAVQSTYKTSGEYSENVIWRYDSSTFTIYLCETGKAASDCYGDDSFFKDYWFKLVDI